MLLAGAAAVRSLVCATGTGAPSQFRSILLHTVRDFGRSMTILTFEAHGEPEEVLELQQDSAADKALLGPGDVRLELVAAPINPSDINTIQGNYPLKPRLPGVPGHEGVMRVVETGPQAGRLRVGDRVVPVLPALGTWRSGGVFKEEGWHRVPPRLSDEAAATLCINPLTALCMVEDFVGLKAGDVVVQNGATSAVGQHVIQLCKSRGIHTINIIRDRPDWEATVDWLKEMGADVVTKEETAKQAAADSGLPPGALGLNCVGGSAALAVAKLLRQSGTVVTYGAMALQPVPVPASLLIFKDLSFRGFWLSGGWAAKEGPEGRAKLLDRVAELYVQGSLRAPRLKTFPLPGWREALAANSRAHRNSKVAFVAH